MKALTLWRVAFEADPLQTSWFVGEYGWVLGDVAPLREHQQCKGAQGLWSPPGDVLKRCDTRKAGG
jgi:hypothetical protein